LQRKGIKKINAIVKLSKQVPFIPLHYRGQLVHITDKKHLHATKTHLVVSSDVSQYHVYRIQQVGPEHTHLVNDQQFHIQQHLALSCIHVQVPHMDFGVLYC
jgi:hypothetical protein